jgi:hypothetical protein
MNMDYPLHRNLLVADNETFADASPSIIKAVDGDYRSENYIPHLDYDELDTLARRSIGGSRQGIWENDCY